MVWFYEREGRTLLCEVRASVQAPGYEIILTYPTGQTQLEMVETDEELLSRFSRLQDRLVEDGWAPQRLAKRAPRAIA